MVGKGVKLKDVIFHIVHYLQNLLHIYYYSGKGLRMIMLVSLIVLLRDFLVSIIIRMVHLVPTSPFIQLNDFCTCIWCGYTCILITQHNKQKEPLYDQVTSS